MSASKPIGWLARVLRLIAVFTLFFSFAGHARADCPVNGGMPLFNYGSVVVSESLAIGEVIPGTVRTYQLVGKCTSNSTFNRPVVTCPLSGAEVSGMTGVYPTNVAGVGTRMRDGSGKPLIGTGACSTDSSLGTVGATGDFNVAGSFELVKTGPISGGSFSGVRYDAGVLNTGIALNNGVKSMTIPNGTPVRTVTCSVSSATANQTVTLPTIGTSTLGAAGAVAGKTSFKLDLICQPGVKVAVTFSSTSGNTGVPSVLASTGSAQGVGVQLLDSAQAPLALDSALPLTAGTTGNTSFTFFAQYYRLGAAAVSPGDFHATAIFTMSYQ